MSAQTITPPMTAPRRGPGRPCRDPEGGPSMTRGIPFSTREWADLQDRARKHGVTVAMLVRGELFGYPIERDPWDD